MPRYAYSGRNRSGSAAQGDLEAPSRRDALRVLGSRGVQVSSVTELNAPTATQDKKAARTKRAAEKAVAQEEGAGSFQLSFSTKKDNSPRAAERLSFLEALYDLTTSGLSAGEAVRLLSVRITDPRLKRLSGGLWEQLSEGAPLSRAMASFPKVFDPSTINLIQAGEATGSLNETLQRLIDHLNERRELQRQLLTAMAYPIFMVVVAGGVVLFFQLVLLPQLQTLLNSLGGTMPASTRMLVGASDFLKHYGIFVLIAGALGAVSFWRWRHTEVGRIKSDAWLLQLPLLGPFIVDRTVLEFSQTLSVLLENGINASEALRMTERQITNRVHREAFHAATDRVLEGEALSAALTRTKAFPDLVLDRLSVGENTGNVVPSLRDIAKKYQKLISQRLSAFTGIIATAVLMAVFAMVAFIAFAIVSAVFQVSASFK
jgi:type II secretory pathway component PulF